MEKIRKGNDISILWEIMRGTEEVPYDLTGKDLTLYIKSMYKTEKVTDFTTDGNVLKWTFLGKNQSHTGVYSLTLVENEGKEDMHTVDECHAFELVNCSSKVGGDAESHVQIKIVSLKSAILLSAILPDKELDTNSTNVVENGAIAREFEATNKRIDELKIKHEVEIDSSLSTESENPVQNKVITDALNDKQDSITDLGTIRSNANKGATAVQPNDLSRVATSGSYNDLSNTPDIPSEITESTVSGWGFTKNVGTYVKPNGGIPKDDLSDTVQESLDKADTALQTHQDISHLATKDELEDKQESLVSGVNIKTINGESVLGGGNIEIKGGGESYDDSELRGLIEGKQDKLEDNVNIKTINGTSLLGSGNIVISGEGGESYDDTELRDMIANKVDKIEGKGLSTEDYTTEEKEKLMSLENYDDSGLKDDISKKQDKLVSGESIKTVNGESILGSGDITIPSESYDDTVIKADIESLKTSKVNKNDVATINGQSLLNGGNITISGGGSSYDDTELRNLIANKADKSGEYLDMSVGLAEDLGNRPFYDEAEFSFRASAGEASVKDGLATIVKLKGNSVVWNNQSENSLSQDSTTQSLPIGSKLVQGHKYLMLAESITNCTLFLYYNIDGSNVRKRFENTYSFFTSDDSISANGLISGQGALWWYVLVQDSTVEYSANNVRLIDLTQMFQAGNEPTTIEEFNARKPIVEDEYAYNEGEVIHMTAEGIKSVGDNAWDEEWELGNIDGNTGELISGNFVRSKNPIPIIGGEQYFCNKRNILAYNGLFCYDSEGAFIQRVDSRGGYYTLPQNAAFIRFRMIRDYGTIYNNDIMITLVHSGWKQDTDAGYQPYWEDRLIFDQRIKDEFPNGMKSAGTAHDVAYNDMNKGVGVTETRIGVVDMGDLDWEYVSEANGAFFRANIPQKRSNTVREEISRLICPKYNIGAVTYFSNPKSNKTIYESASLGDLTQIYVCDSSYTDAATFKAAMQGVMLYYELAEPTIIEYDEPFNLDYRVADFGTEQAIAETNSAPISAKIEYGFGANDTIRTNKLAISALKKELHDSYATTQSVREAIEEAITTTLNTEV